LLHNPGLLLRLQGFQLQLARQDPGVRCGGQRALWSVTSLTGP
jgi:hypothetical protein